MRSRLDRGSIGPRSWGSSTAILCRPMEIQRSEGFHASPQWKEVGVIESHPMRIVRSESIHTTPQIAKIMTVHAVLPITEKSRPSDEA